MKRLLQILLLTGVTLVWALAPVSQIVKAEKSKDEISKINVPYFLYEGPITLIARLYSDYPQRKTKVEWTLTGTVLINFPKSNLKKKARIEFIEFNQITNILSLSLPGDDVCTDVYYSYRETYPPFDVYGDFYSVKDKVFKLPVKVGESQLTGFTVAGTCKGTGDPVKGKLTSGYDGYPNLMDPINLFVVGQGETYLNGYCTLPLWEIGTDVNNTYSDDCHWEAYKSYFTQVPEWWTIVEKRKK
jgi:hypothetical protein